MSAGFNSDINMRKILLIILAQIVIVAVLLLGAVFVFKNMALTPVTVKTPSPTTPTAVGQCFVYLPNYSLTPPTDATIKPKIVLRDCARPNAGKVISIHTIPTDADVSNLCAVAGAFLEENKAGSVPYVSDNSYPDPSQLLCLDIN